MRKKIVLVQFLRHSGFWLTNCDDVNIVVDPIFSSRYGSQQSVHPSFEPAAIEKADAVPITHPHSDHFDRENVRAIVEKTVAAMTDPSDAMNLLNLPDAGIKSVRIIERALVRYTGVGN